MTGVVLDAGALIALERGNRSIALVVQRARRDGDPLVVPAGVVARVWRGGRRQVQLGRLLRGRTCEVVPLDERDARLAGVLLRVSGTTDVVDASVTIVARRRGLPIITSDADDLRRLDPSVVLIPI